MSSFGSQIHCVLTEVIWWSVNKCQNRGRAESSRRLRSRRESNTLCDSLKQTMRKSFLHLKMLTVIDVEQFQQQRNSLFEVEVSRPVLARAPTFFAPSKAMGDELFPSTMWLNAQYFISVTWCWSALQIADLWWCTADVTVLWTSLKNRSIILGICSR